MIHKLVLMYKFKHAEPKQLYGTMCIVDSHCILGVFNSSGTA